MKEKAQSGEAKDGSLTPRMFCPNVSIVGEMKMSASGEFLKRKCVVCLMFMKTIVLKS